MSREDGDTARVPAWAEVARREALARPTPRQPEVDLHGWLDEPKHDLATNLPGYGLLREATRRRQACESDLSWRIGADGEDVVATALRALTHPCRPARTLRRSTPGAVQVLHSVKVGVAAIADLDHPPVVVAPRSPAFAQVTHRKQRFDHRPHLTGQAGRITSRGVVPAKIALAHTMRSWRGRPPGPGRHTARTGPITARDQLVTQQSLRLAAQAIDQGNSCLLSHNRDHPGGNELVKSWTPRLSPAAYYKCREDYRAHVSCQGFAAGHVEHEGRCGATGIRSCDRRLVRASGTVPYSFYQRLQRQRRVSRTPRELHQPLVSTHDPPHGTRCSSRAVDPYCRATA